MFTIVGYSLLQLITLYGWGAILQRLLKQKSSGLGETGLLGIIGVAAIATVWSIFAPTSWLAFVLYPLGLLAAVQFRPTQLPWLGVILFLTMLFPIYIASTQYDTGLYHLPQMIWERIYALPLGLANFHSRFGFNSIWVTYASSFGFGSAWQVSTFLVNASVLYYAVLFFLGSLNNKRKHLSVLTLAIFLFYLLYELYYPYNLGGPNTDFSSQLVGIIGLHYFFTFFTSRDKSDLIKAMTFVTFSTMFKFSNAGIAIVPIIYGVVTLKRELFESRLVWLTLGAFTFWIIRNLIITGCLVTVFSETCLPVPWSALEQTKYASMWVKSWARFPGVAPEIVLANFDWIQVFWLPYMMSLRIIKISLVLTSLVAVKLLLFRKQTSGLTEGIWWTLLAIAGFFAVWFGGAPDFRFAAMYIAYTCALLATILVYPLLTRFSFFLKPLLLLTICLFLGVSLVKTIKFRQQLTDQWPRFTTPAASVIDTNELGMEMHILNYGDQCFDVPYCTPEYTQSLTFEKVLGNRLLITR